MEKAVYENYLAILKMELVPALGCTEPIAIAYAAAKARDILGTIPDHIEISCSGNIIKNVMGVTVPNSNGMKGIKAAAVLGIVGGNAEAGLEVLQNVTPGDIELVRKLITQNFCSVSLRENVENLYITATVTKAGQTASVTIRNRHTCITEIKKNGSTVFSRGKAVDPGTGSMPDRSLLTINGILEFADTVAINDIQAIFDRQISCNTAIAEEGLRHQWGAQVGRTIIDTFGDRVEFRAAAKAAAGSDARMGGCSLPVIINSGSGNQGMSVSLPVIEYARELHAGPEKLYRALTISNLVSIHQKSYIGGLSAFCGAVSAAMGAGAAIAYLFGSGQQTISQAIVNTLANAGGIICDGAKPSCAAKIATSIQAAILGCSLAVKHRTFLPGEGIVKNSVEETIRSMGYIGRVGMKGTDREVLNVMIGTTDTKAPSPGQALPVA